MQAYRGGLPAAHGLDAIRMAAAVIRLRTPPSTSINFQILNGKKEIGEDRKYFVIVARDYNALYNKLFKERFATRMSGTFRLKDGQP